MQAKPKRGRKPLNPADKKKAVTIYLKQNIIAANGGMDQVRKKIHNLFNY